MTTKDYELVASGIYMAVIDDGKLDEIRVAASHIANKLQLNDPYFDRKKFLADCGLVAA